MERLWAPWRMEYLEGKQEQGCIFCTKPQVQEDRKNGLVHRGRHAFLILNAFPYSNGHLLFAPYRHTADLLSLAAEEMEDLMTELRVGMVLLREVLRPEGFNIGFNLGKVAGAGIVDHVHGHLVPRWAGDTNFMPVTCNTRVMPEELDRTYERLTAIVNREGILEKLLAMEGSLKRL